MNILFVTSDFPPRYGGIATFNYHICKELSLRKHKIIVLTNCLEKSRDYDSKQNFIIKRLKNKIRPTSVETIYNILSLIPKE